MVIGNGLIGGTFKKYNYLYDNILIFASGVSNSTANSIDNFKREKKLILDTIAKNKELTFVYFSSILAGVSNNDYYKHKIEMEELIKLNTNNYIIFKVPQIIGVSGNKNNLINYITDNIKKKNKINLYKNISRAIVDVDDMVNIVNYCIKKTNSGTIYFSDIEKLNVIDIVLMISNNLSIKPLLNFVENKNIINWTSINSKIIDNAITDLGINRNNYTNKIIKKYTN